MQVKLPVTWEMCGYIYVEANSVESAADSFDPDEHELPTKHEYVDGSFALSSTDIEYVKILNDSGKAR